MLMNHHGKGTWFRWSCAVLMVVAGIVFGSSGPAWADDLDKISGTEGWRDKGQLHAKTEWKDWYRARVAWRKARQEIRLERARNIHLAQLLRRGRPRISEVRRIMRGRLRRPMPTPVRVRVERQRRPAPAPRAEEPPDEDEDRARDVLETRPEKKRPVAPAYKVKPERLDKSGQAIDDEGDALLKKGR